jgi:hypothetical protein
VHGWLAAGPAGLFGGCSRRRTSAVLLPSPIKSRERRSHGQLANTFKSCSCNDGDETAGRSLLPSSSPVETDDADPIRSKQSQKNEEKLMLLEEDREYSSSWKRNGKGT